MMALPFAIKVENLSKRYELGARAPSQQTLRDALVETARRFNPFAPNSARRQRVDELWALDQVSFELQPGEVVGVIGRNGAGKSTLLKILSRITEPTEGRVGVRGRIASLLEVGTGFHAELTGRENIYLNGAILGMTREEIKSKFDAIVAFAEIEKFLDTPVKRYSSGMYMRLAFAVAAHLDPDILIVDEVLAVGDLEFQKKCLGKVSEIASQGRTVLFVSHSMAAISTLTNRVFLMEKGHIKFNGDTIDGVKHYLNFMSSSEAVYLSEKRDTLHQITEVSIPSLENGDTHISGNTLKIKVVTQSKERAVPGCLSIQIVNENLQPVLHLRAYDYGIYFGQEKGETVLTCEVVNCGLNVGRYSLNVYLSGPPGSEIFETLQGICTFEVEVHNQIALWGWRADVCSYIVPEAWVAEQR